MKTPKFRRISSQPRYDHFDTTPYELLMQGYYSNEPMENQGEMCTFSRNYG